jgi:hypothetical protein
MTPGEISETASVRKPLPVFGQETYASIPTEELVVFAVQFLHADGIPATLEEIVSVCFKLFPHGFSLKNYFYWPDSARVSLHLNNAKDKGYIKGNAADGFIVKVAGRRIVKQVARTLGIAMPMPPKVDQPAETEPIQAPVEALAPREKKKPVKKKKAPPPKKVSKRAGKTPVKKSKPAAKEAAKKKVVVKKPQVKKKRVPSKRQTAFTPGPKPKARKSIQRKPKAIRKVAPRIVKQRTRKTQPVPVGTRAAKKTAPMKPAERRIESAPVTKEERIKAGKVVHMMERSDAYRQYRKFGAKARISEFDFRNMLFATMESSAETLKRNVELFKKYAGIQNRADLVAFLDYAEGNFARLLKPSKQPARKK